MYRPQKSLSRRQMAAMLALLIGLMPFSVDAYLPALPQIATALNTNIHHVEQSLSGFMFGVAVGQIIGGSLADIKGRRNIALTGLLIYALASLVLIFVQTDTQLLTIRMVQALGAGISAVVVGAIVRDNYQGRDAAQMFTLIGMIVMLAPLIAPLLGSILQSLGGWRLIFGFLWLYGTAVALILYRFLPQHKLAEPICREQLNPIFGRYREVLTTRTALGFLAYQAASFSVMLVFLTESPFVYIQLYHLSPHEYAGLFGCNVLMMLFCNRLTAFGLRHNWHSRDLLKWGIGLQVLANVALFALVLLMQQPPLYLIVPLIVIAIGTLGLISSNAQALFMNHFRPEIGGSASAIFSCSQSLIASLIGFLTTFLHNGTIHIMSSMMFASTMLGLCLLCWFSGSQLFHTKQTQM
ncbi:MAG: multidrug effflux MFS transporter [Alysiella sp.]|uniref:multidrug effflux MFS transporter n=1 Tax=Alysiella sp. TaxID=1872483 RepID=UPI0026DCCA75|nr:multidrug effflux MFS transporter [Alysiella sp.]MDO4434152.1 multidrug effflux MFS transporter [Alysiella sp.]